jgi:hypothetical protein
VLLPVVEPGVPEDAERWSFIEVDGVQVYLEAGIDLQPEAVIQIGVDRFLKWHRLWIEGVETRM